MKTADSEACGLLPISAETLGFFWMPFFNAVSTTNKIPLTHIVFFGAGGRNL